VASNLSGRSLALTVGGFVLAWSGIKGQTLKVTLTDLLHGKPPPAAAEAPPSIGITSGGAPAGGSAASPGGGVITSVPGGKTISPAAAYSALRSAGVPAAAAVTLTAIGGAESGWNVNALNNDPATGDYSVGVWQINYYGDLMASRTAEFGPPSELIGNLDAQATAAATLYRQSGLGNWTTYTRGTYQAFLPQALAAAAGPGV
jgi:hypothetical protein